MWEVVWYLSITVLEAADRAHRIAAAQVVAADGHFLAGQLVLDHVDLQPGVGGVLAVGIALGDLAQRLAGLRRWTAWSRPTSTICSK